MAKPINIRTLDEDTYEGIKLNAAARGITVGEYLGRLYELHQLAKLYPKRADVGDLLVDASLEEVSR